MPRKSKASRTKTKAPTIIPADQLPTRYSIADETITALQIYHNPERKPEGKGPWSDEADKVAWVDEATGLGCIILRQENGTLSGYVGVGPDHPLFAFKSDAVPLDLCNSVHGGITYGKECEVNRFAKEEYGDPRIERYTVCHTLVTRVVRKYRTVQTTDDEFEHEDLWWLGFDTDHPGDLVPIPRYGREPKKTDIYRDQAFIYNQCIAFARRLTDVASVKANGDQSSKPLRLPPPEADGNE